MPTRKPTPMPSTAARPLIETGQAAPPWRLRDQHGREHALKDYRGRWVVLYFYPRDATPGCTTEACGFRDAHVDFESRGAAVLGVSPDDEASHDRFARKHDLPFALLADIDKQVCQSYGVWQAKMLYGRSFMGVMRTTYLIDPKGRVAQRWDKVRVANHEQEVLEALSALSPT
jgi:thioredoxin-dependent peroxiredoxin